VYCRNGQYSTEASVLEELREQHVLPGIILEHRKLSKLMTGFVDTLIEVADKEAKRQVASGQGMWTWMGRSSG
jgi:DNA polymerase-1